MKKLRCDGIAIIPVVRKKTFLIMKVSTALIFAACLSIGLKLDVISTALILDESCRCE